MYLESICQLGNEPTEKMIKMEWGSRVDLLLNTEEIKPITMRRLNWNIEYISCYRDLSTQRMNTITRSTNEINKEKGFSKFSANKSIYLQLLRHGEENGY